MHSDAPDGTYWKTQYIVEYAAGRPFAWVDDEITALDRAWVAAHPVQALLLPVDPWVGLVRPDFDALAEWAGAPDVSR